MTRVQIRTEASSEFATGEVINKIDPEHDFRFDSSVNRGDFRTPIGVGRVIQGKLCDGLRDLPTVRSVDVSTGWDKGVVEMSLGEKSVLTIPG